jgi:uncharacterized protein YdeI (YjbR/CyaY-like superfamily)
LGKRIKQVNAYIAKSPEWARPILTSFRETVHAACPDCEEAMKWSTPTFMYHGILCGMAAFKEYCALHFWKGELIFGKGLGGGEGAAAQFGRLTSAKDMPSKKLLTRYVKRAMELNEQGVQLPKRPAKPKKPLAMPADFKAAIKKSKRAHATYEAFSPSHQREYLEWITDAKADETRSRRVAQAVEWMAEGKARNWKYMR